MKLYVFLSFLIDYLIFISIIVKMLENRFTINNVNMSSKLIYETL